MKKLTLPIAILLNLAFLSCPADLAAEEPAERFLEALVENGYYDTAIDYLNGAESSDLVSADFRKMVPFEKANVLIKSTSRIRDLEKWDARLAEAEKLLDQFASQGDTPETVIKTQRYRGDLLYKRARVFLARAEGDRVTAADKNELRTKARGMLEQSLDVFQKSQTSLRSFLENYKVDLSDPESESRRKFLRGTYTQVSLKIPLVQERTAETYKVDEPQYAQLTKQAAEGFGEIYGKYSQYPAGMDAALFSARCYRKIQEPQEALTMLGYIFEQSNTSAFRNLKRRALLLATECWSLMEPYPFDTVIRQCEPVLNVLGPPELRQPDWLLVQLELAKAYQLKSVELAKDKSNNAEARKLEREAAKLAKKVAKTPGVTRERANKLLSGWNIKVVEDKEPVATGTLPKTFDEARNQAKDQVSELNVLASDLELTRRNLAGAPAAEKEALQLELKDKEAKLISLANQTLQTLDAADSLKPVDSPPADANHIRYLKAYCFYAMEHHLEAIVLGEFMLDYYPTTDWTRPCSALMVKSLREVYNAAPKNDRAQEKDHLDRVCTKTIGLWPGSDESNRAAATLGRLAIIEKDFETAETHIAALSSNSPELTPLTMSLGRGLIYKLRNQQKTAEPGSLKGEFAKAKEFLQDGLNSVDPKRIDYETALSALFLVDGHLMDGETDLAIKRLESEKVAPLDLIKQGHASVTNTKMESVFRRETYNTALRAYLAAMKTGTNQQNWINKARGIIVSVRDEAENSNDPKDKARLTNMYLMIASELKEQFGALTNADEKAKFAETLGSFLTSIENESTDASTVKWAGSTLLETAESLNESNMSNEATAIFQKAVSALNRAEKIGFGDDAAGKADKKDLRRLRALAQRGSGNYEEALKGLSELIKERSNARLQLESAKTLYLWGVAAKREKAFAEALAGRDVIKDPKTGRQRRLIIGFRNLAPATYQKPGAESIYFESMYYLIDSQFRYGELKNNDNAIKSAAKELKKLKARSPGCGGPGWKQKFDALDKKIASKNKK